MPKKRKQVVSFSLSQDVRNALRDLGKGPYDRASASWIVEMAILALHEKHFAKEK